MNWNDVLPEPLAIEQRTWELNHALLRAFNAGAPVNDMAARFGVSTSRIHQRINRAERRPVSPVERYFAEPPVTGPTYMSHEPGRLKDRPHWPWKPPEERKRIRERDDYVREQHERWRQREEANAARISRLEEGVTGFADPNLFWPDDEPATIRRVVIKPTAARAFARAIRFSQDDNLEAAAETASDFIEELYDEGGTAVLHNLVSAVLAFLVHKQEKAVLIDLHGLGVIALGDCRKEMAEAKAPIG